MDKTAYLLALVLIFCLYGLVDLNDRLVTASIKLDALQKHSSQYWNSCPREKH